MEARYHRSPVLSIAYATLNIKLAAAIRKGGNLGAHFDLERQPDEQVATLMLDLIEYLVEYFFVLPTRIEHLTQRVATIPDRGGTDGTAP